VIVPIIIVKSSTPIMLRVSHYSSSSLYSTLLLDARAGVILLWVSVVLASCVGKTRVVLGLARDSVVGDTTKSVLGLATGDTASADSGFTDGTATGGERGFLATGANVYGASIRGVEVGSDGWLLREREVGLSLVDSLGVALDVDSGVRVALLRRNHFEYVCVLCIC
jgi:hypothetical protein